ncbi:glycosyltransferase family 2 protein [Bifidobacterium sp. ESL0745]|nr:glycosyltransferase family 2 protein [Bifidobacterium sp. ESL0745]MDF7665586.1 glycosyltransferase family 2 protein [Bifidobacterium sp. ESL0745]
MCCSDGRSDNELITSPKLSIVLPTYNVEKYIARCIRSILNLSFSDYEVIFVNDGSTDKTSKVFESQRPDSRFRMITTKNQGSGPARNCGLRAAAGEYVYFMDPDDELIGDPFIRSLSLMDQKKLDLLFFGYIQKDMNDGSETSCTMPEEMFSADSEEFRTRLLKSVCNNMSANSVWNKIIRKSYLTENGLLFPKMRAGQDAVFSWELYRNMKRSAAIKDIGYRYSLNRPGSVRSSYRADRFFNDMKAVNAVKQDISAWGLNELYKNLYVRFGVYVVREEIRNQMQGNCINSKVILKSGLYKSLENVSLNNLSWKNRIKLLLVKLSAHGFYKPITLLLK